MTTEEIRAWQNEQMRGMANIAPESRFIDCKFAIGEVVRLNSGGMNMVVSTNPSPNGDLECRYYDHGEIKSTTINEMCLKRVRWWSWL